MRTRILAGALVSALAFAACGGGHNAALPSNQTTGSSSKKAANTTFVVTIPPKRTTGNSARSRAYISANVQAIEIDVAQNGTTVGANFYPVSSSQTYCSAPPLGGLVCTLPLWGPPGTDTFTVNTFDAPTELLANIISTGTVTATIVAQQANQVNVATSGAPTVVGMSVDDPFPTAPITEQVHMLVTDADDNIIVGPYDAPVTLTNSDTTGAITLSSASVANASAAGALFATYNGNPVSGGATITAHITGMGVNYNGANPATMHFGPQSAGVVSSPSFLSFVSMSDTPQTITLSGENGATAAFLADTNNDAWNDIGARHSLTDAHYYYQHNCAGIVSVSAGASANTFTVSPVAPGVCYLNLSDSATPTANRGFVTVAVQSSAPLVGATPAPQFTVTPSQISLTATGQTGNFTASEPGYTGSWNVSSSNTNVATVAATPGTAPGTFTVTAGAAGQSLITVKDDNGLVSTVTVTVTTSGVSPL